MDIKMEILTILCLNYLKCGMIIETHTILFFYF